MTIEDMINHVSNGELTKANDVFNSLLNDKMQAALDQESIAIANTVFNGTNESEEDDSEELEFDNEDLEFDEEEMDQEELDDEYEDEEEESD